jgi:hypothetical protein
VNRLIYACLCNPLLYFFHKYTKSFLFQILQQIADIINDEGKDTNAKVHEVQRLFFLKQMETMEILNWAVDELKHIRNEPTNDANKKRKFEDVKVKAETPNQQKKKGKWSR